MYIVFVGLVFSTLLRDVDLGDLLPWVNAVVHFVTPIAVLLDWVLRPPRVRIPRSAPLLWLAVPAAYVGYTLVRGPLARFYPYPFFDPAEVGGYGGVALYCAAMLAALVVLALLIRLLGLRGASSLPDPDAEADADASPRVTRRRRDLPRARR